MSKAITPCSIPGCPICYGLLRTEPGAIIEYDPRIHSPWQFENLAPTKVYLIGALKNRSIIDLGIKIRELGYDVFDDWLSPGPEADEQWQEYEAQRGRTYKEALNSHHADTVFNYDYKHLNEAQIVVMVLPCGKSGHLEFGWSIGQGKTGYILFDGEPDRYDIMYRFANDVFFDEKELLDVLGTSNKTS